jgi:hypothetical protein
MAEKFLALRASDDDLKIVEAIRAQYSTPWHEITASEAIRYALRHWNGDDGYEAGREVSKDD